jgi:hypothetical protein
MTTRLSARQAGGASAEMACNGHDAFADCERDECVGVVHAETRDGLGDVALDLAFGDG